MDISPAHEAARLEAARLPALYASLALLQQTDPPQSGPATISLYSTTRPAPGAAAGGDPLVTMLLAAAAGTVDEALYQLNLTTPIEGQITGADEVDGSIPVWARVSQPDGAWWSDASVSVQGAGGEIQMSATGVEGGEPVVRLFNGAFARLTLATFGG